MSSEKASLVDESGLHGRSVNDSGGRSKTGGASFGMTVITLCKICVGTGVLAVPHAFSQGGALPSFLSLLLLLCWNDWSANRLLSCRSLLSERERSAFAAQCVESPLGALARVRQPSVECVPSFLPSRARRGDEARTRHSASRRVASV